jgi:hypothetical protein
MIMVINKYYINNEKILPEVCIDDFEAAMHIEVTVSVIAKGIYE